MCGSPQSGLSKYINKGIVTRNNTVRGMIENLIESRFIPTNPLIRLYMNKYNNGLITHSANSLGINVTKSR